jgi:2-dehydro-3-deoxyphosphogluconate aldolase/(4S)-4-hydroxy-2-oxoglutarate aldolase
MEHEVIAALRRVRVVPVVRTSAAAHAATAVRWLHAAGLRCFEITLTVPDAPALIAELSAEPGLLVGAGTVPDRAAAEACLRAGARFLVTPWFDPEVIGAAHAAGAAALPGAMTPTEVRAAHAAGADAVKIFPASSAGGPGHIRALRSVFPDIAFCPTGGVDADTAPAYFAAGAAFVGMGGKLVDEKLLAAGDRGAVQDAAARVLALA